MRCRIAPCLIAWILLAAPFAAVAKVDAGQIRLIDHLEALRAQGVRLIYSSDLVAADMMIDEPAADEDPAAALRRVLEPFQLAVEEGPSGSLLIVSRAAKPATVAPRRLVIDDSMPEIVVTSSLHRIEYSEVGARTIFDQELVGRVPVVGDEVVRLTHRLPGTASGGISSKSHVRGGEEDEVLFLFDGLRLYEPYHLRDFQSVSTVINSRAVDSIDFYTGAYPAHYGDRMSGVLSMEMREPQQDTETELSLSFFNASALSLGSFGGQEEGEWLLSARRGNLDLIAHVIDPDAGSPEYQDYLAHVGWEFGPRAQISANLLYSNDEIRLADNNRGEHAAATYANRVGWLKWDADWSDSLRSRSIFAVSEIEDARNGSVDQPGMVTGQLNDLLDVNVFEFRQDWTWVAGERSMWSFGANIKHLDAHYRHLSERTIDPVFQGISGEPGQRVLDTEITVDGAQYAAYAELRWRVLDHLILDAGMRWDQQTYTVANNDRQISPRASLLFQASDNTEVRLGWGQYYQAQETNELQVSDGIDSYFPAQRAEHFVANIRHTFSDETSLDVSLFRKSFRTLRPRFENVFNKLSLVPELQFDRVMIDPDKAESLGAEATLTHGASDEAVFWWLSYAWARTRDWTANGKIARSWDQTHAVEAGISRKAGPWSLSATAEVHTGWPKTELTAEYTSNPDGSLSLSVMATARNDDRHLLFASVDLYVGREFDVSRGDLSVFLSVSNVLNRGNPCCTEYSLDENSVLQSRTAHWLPLVPSLGLIWQF
jgi:outer membrane receptor protein involved in Fe transport